MEACVLQFARADQAEAALTELVESQGAAIPWLHEVGVVKRPLIGRISIRATYAESPEIREGDIASQLAEAGKWTGYLVGSLAGPLRARVEALRFKRTVAPAAKEVEKMLLGIDDIKALLPRGSSALVLAASSEICERMVQLFSQWQPEVLRRTLSGEVQKLLEDFHRQAELGTEAAAQ
ncbi:MAG: hypothetical protein ABSC94_16795 [Polyangiaceae bacterium]|jgi:hypothetical protein